MPKLRISAMFAHLHVRSWFSFQAGGSSPGALAKAAASHSMPALALTDVGGFYGAVRFQQACEEVGVDPIFGAELNVEGSPLVLLAASRTGYANLCHLLTLSHERIDEQANPVTLREIAPYTEDLFCLTHTYEGRLYQLIDERRVTKAREWIENLKNIFGDRLSIEVTHKLRKGDRRRTNYLRRLAKATSVPLAATGDVRYASRKDYRRYDLLCCARLGQAVFENAPARPYNSEGHLKSEGALRKLIPYEEAFLRAAEIASICRGVDLLPGRIDPPRTMLAEDDHPRNVLRRRCRQALLNKYDARRREALDQLNKELSIIADLELSDFFLVVAEVVDEANRRGIRCSGRGSAANSIVTYLLGITGVDPLEHNLLFERFLHRGRQGTPDIDIDFDSERRDEIIDWMEERFGTDHTAMTATVVTYRLRSALRDAGKALGFPLEDLDRLAKALPRHGASLILDYEQEVKQHLGRSRLTRTLVEMVHALDDCPRYLGLHSGGMVLAREPLNYYTPVQRSANGVAQVQFDKNDIEPLGLVKLDVLGLRMLSTVSEAQELIRHHEDADFDVDALPKDDIQTFNMIRASRTIGCFQIESQGQLHLIGMHQPDRFEDLIAGVALFRPGPLQGGMVHPFVRRRQGKEPVRYEHPDLEPILRDTYGVILFQEQLLEIAHRFAGMPLDEADEFRRNMTEFRDPDAMEDRRAQFVDQATARGVPEKNTHTVFDQIAGFVGYGFCRSHAAAFAKTVYESAYLKRHYPAAFMAAVMQHRPGMYDQQTLEEEARHFGVQMRGPCVIHSGVRYEIEHLSKTKRAIRKPLTAVKGMSAEVARRLVLERLHGPFADLEDFYRRVALPSDVQDRLARAGALRMLEESRRAALWKLGALRKRLGPSGESTAPTLFQHPALTAEDIPLLPLLSAEDRVSWDLQTHLASGRHPVTLVRRKLQALEVRTIETCYRMGRHVRTRGKMTLKVGGRVMLRQQPPTAKGVMFITLEDETGHVQCVVPPAIQTRYSKLIRQSALIVKGKLEADGNWRGLLVKEMWPVAPLLGGYEGYPSSAGGRGEQTTTRQAALAILKRSDN